MNKTYRKVQFHRHITYIHVCIFTYYVLTSFAIRNSANGTLCWVLFGTHTHFQAYKRPHAREM